MKTNFPKVKQFEIVYFVTSLCNNNCNHCWSHDLFLGQEISLDQHKQLLKQIDYSLVSEFKISGGEPTVYRDLPKFITLARSIVPTSVRIVMFSNGSFLFENGRIPSYEQISTILNELFKDNNIELHISVDEYHIQSHARRNRMSFSSSVLEYQKLVEHTTKYSKNSKSLIIKYKLHCDFDRLQFHRNSIFADVNSKVWNDCFIKTEGLANSGNAKLYIENTIKIAPSDMWTAFILPGCTWSSHPNELTRSKFILCENNQTEEIYLNLLEGDASVVMGWWNLIEKQFCGGTFSDFINFYFVRHQ